MLRQRFCTALCRGRRLCRPFCPVSPDCLFCSDTATVASQTYFFCCARKSRQKDALGDALYCALPRAIFSRPGGRRFFTLPIAFSSGKCTTRIFGQTASISILLISGILGGYDSAQQFVGADAHIGPRSAHRFHGNLRRIRRCAAISTAACFTIFLRGNDYRWERCHHAGGAVV